MIASLKSATELMHRLIYFYNKSNYEKNVYHVCMQYQKYSVWWNFAHEPFLKLSSFVHLAYEKKKLKTTLTYIICSPCLDYVPIQNTIFLLWFKRKNIFRDSLPPLDEKNANSQYSSSTSYPYFFANVEHSLRDGKIRLFIRRHSKRKRLHKEHLVWLNGWWNEADAKGLISFHRDEWKNGHVYVYSFVIQVAYRYLNEYASVLKKIHSRRYQYV